MLMSTINNQLLKMRFLKRKLCNQTKRENLLKLKTNMVEKISKRKNEFTLNDTKPKQH